MQDVEELSSTLMELAPRCVLHANTTLAEVDHIEPFADAVGYDTPERAANYIVRLLTELRFATPSRLDAGRLFAKHLSLLPIADGVWREAAWDLLLSEASKVDALTAQALREVAAPIPDLPLVSSVVTEFGGRKAHAQRAQLIACQHLFASTVSQIQYLRQAIPQLEVVEVAGKPYSTNVAAATRLADAGVAVSPYSFGPEAAERYQIGSFAGRHRGEMRRVVARLIAQHPDERSPLIVLDDGGALIDAVGRAAVTGDITRPIIAVEQTAHGLYGARPIVAALKNYEPGFVLINVAESHSKLRHEATLIGESVLAETTRWLDRLGGSARYPTVGVIGWGAVGATIAELLRHPQPQQRWRPADVFVFDHRRSKLAVAWRQKLQTVDSLEEILAGCDVLVSATGGTSINSDAASMLKDGTVLVSASSGDNEFSGLHARDLRATRLLQGVSGPLTRFEASHAARSSDTGPAVTVINSGFPVNFDGSADPIDADRIQLTRALMVGGALQGLEHIAGTSGSTVQILDLKLDKYLSDSFVRLQLGQMDG